MNYSNLRILFLFFIWIPVQNIFAQPPYGNAGEHTAVSIETTDANFGYYEYLPTDFDPNSGETYPLILFYHGLGEKGNGSSELSKVLRHGPPKMIENGTNFEAIVISPQSGSGWFSPNNFLSLYDYLTTNYPVDTNRFYVTGLSAGGGSTWNALKADHTKVAAAIPICGAGSVANPSEFLQQTPIWAHHNFNDGTVGRGQTINNMNRIANTGNSVMDVYPYGTGNTVADDDYTMQFDTQSQEWTSEIGVLNPTDKLSFTLYRNGGHDAWTKTYNNTDVWDWLFSQSLNTVLSVDDFETSSTTVYPNPTSGNLRVKKQNNTEEVLEIYDLTGRKIYSNKISNNQLITIKPQGAGLYMARILTSKNIKKTFKIVIK
ncbi:T9SS type A sorting domain-containing protein [Aquimarina litoralis]|uniref:T9SS type A sorting domain-containing protein n=1 Tax=Aquimarina litoralis TaxID=584605 RepID=UPI001C584D80|nr:T9SS type A sorting domain-containing protein [Aquimarina litoralis]